MNAAQKIALGYDDYLALEARTGEKHEYLEGEAWAMAGGTPPHAQLSARIVMELGILVRGGSCGVYSSDLKLRVLATGLTTYADAVVVCGPIERAPMDRNAVTNPRVIVEVLSDSTEAWDRGGKFAHYRRVPSLQAYVLVSQREARIEVYSRDGKRWTLAESGEGERVELPSLDGGLSVSAVYDGVSLGE